MKLTVSAVDKEETLWNVVLEPEDCLLSTDSLKEDSLCEPVIPSLRWVWAKKCRQGIFSAKVSL